MSLHVSLEWLRDYEARQGRVTGPEPEPSPILVPRTKYGNVPTEVDGYRWASKLEAKHYTQLKHLEAAGIVRYFLWQQPIKLKGGTHRVDWLVVLPNREPIWADSKGADHAAGRRARAEVFEQHKIEIVLWKRDVVL